MSLAHRVCRADQRWHQFDFEGYSCLECGQQPSGLLRIVQHQRALPQKSSDSSSMIGNMAQESHSRCVAAAFPGSHLGCGRPDCVAGHVRFELRNVAANYLFERSHKFPGIQPNSGRRDYSRLSCGVAETQLGPSTRISAAFLARALAHRGASPTLQEFLPIQR
jgi:hypothetical protein